MPSILKHSRMDDNKDNKFEIPEDKSAPSVSDIFQKAKKSAKINDSNIRMGSPEEIDEKTKTKEMYSIWNHRSSHRTVMIIIPIVIVIAYIFFFISPLIFHSSDDEDLTVTPLGTEISFSEGHSVTVDTWDWSPNNKSMIVKLLFDNTAFDGKNSYKFNVKTKKGKSKIKVTEMVADSDFVVLSIYDLPDEWQNVLINVAFEDEKETVVKLYATESSVNQVQNLTAKTSNEYRAELYEEKMKPYQDAIDKNNDEIYDLNAKLATLASEKAEIRKTLGSVLPEDEIATYQERLKAIKSQEDSIHDKIAELEAENKLSQNAMKEYEASRDYYLGKYEDSVTVSNKIDDDNMVVLESTTRPTTQRVVGNDKSTTKKVEIKSTTKE